jgi:hypothetical protein
MVSQQREDLQHKMKESSTFQKHSSRRGNQVAGLQHGVRPYHKRRWVLSVCMVVLGGLGISLLLQNGKPKTSTESVIRHTPVAERPFSLSLADLLELPSGELEHTVEPSRCAAGLSGSLILLANSSIHQHMSLKLPCFCRWNRNHWQSWQKSGKSNPHILRGV